MRNCDCYQPPYVSPGGAQPDTPAAGESTASTHGENEAARDSLLRRLLAPTRWQFSDVLLMGISSWHIVYSYVMYPSSLPQSFIDFLDKMVGDKWIVPVVRVRLCRSPAPRGRPPVARSSSAPPWPNVDMPT